MTENEKIELFDKWYDENYDEWAEGEEGIALREELEQAFKDGIEALEKENAELKKELKDANKKVVHLACNQNKDLKRKINKAKEILADIIKFQPYINRDTMFLTVGNDWKEVVYKAEQFLSEVEK